MIHGGSIMTVASRFGSLKCEWLQGSRMEGEYQGVEGDRAFLGDLNLREGRNNEMNHVRRCAVRALYATARYQ